MRQDVLSVEFRRRLIRALLRDPTFLRTTRRFIDPNDFPKGRERDAVAFILAHYDEFGSPPDEWVFDERSKDLGMDEIELADFTAEFFQEPEDVEFIRSRVVDFARNRRLESAMTEAAGVLGVAPWDELMGMLRQAEVYGDTSESRAVILPRDVDKMGSMESLRRVPTGLSLLDDSLGGGLPVGHLGVAVAPPNRGKSSFLVHHGAAALKAGLSVVHFTLEMSMTQTFARYNAALGGLEKALQRHRGPRRKGPRRKSKSMRAGKASLSIVEREPGLLTPAALADDVKRLSLDGSFEPGLIIVDYPALMRPGRHYEQKRHEIADIFRDLRAYARRTNFAIWAAHQGNRGSMEADRNQKRVIRMDDLAEVFEVAAIVDVMYSINATDEERQSDICRLFMAKNRLGEANQVGTVLCDFRRCKFVDDEGDNEEDD